MSSSNIPFTEALSLSPVAISKPVWCDYSSSEEFQDYALQGMLARTISLQDHPHLSLLQEAVKAWRSGGIVLLRKDCCSLLIRDGPVDLIQVHFPWEKAPDPRIQVNFDLHLYREALAREKLTEVKRSIGVCCGSFLFAGIVTLLLGALIILVVHSLN